jgi:pimeloyl-ACP methyl ester carboxylesterase
MPAVELKRAGAIAYREATPEHGAERAPAAMFLHGFPSSSFLWRNVLPAAAEAGWLAVAPDLPGFGDSEPDLPGTWERQIQNVERFHSDLALGPVALVVHDWGGLIGLRWACDNPGLVRALVISDTGFFSFGRWHGMAKTFQTEGDGERAMEALNRDLLGAALRQQSPALGDDVIDEFMKAFADPDRRQNGLDLYRSGDFSKLEPYDGRLAELGVPTLILWGAGDEFAPVGGAYTLKKQIEHAELVVLEGAGHFAQEDAPDRYAAEVGRFLGSLTLAG